MNARTQITLDAETQRRAQAKAAELRISFAEYVRRLVAEDLGAKTTKADISVIFDLVNEGRPTDIARDKSKMLDEAMWHEYRAETAGNSTRSTKLKKPTL